MGDLLLRYEGAVFALCFRMVHDRELASELAQETFFRAIKGFDGYDGESRLQAWLLRIATNTCLTYFRRQKYRNHASLDAGSSDGSGGAGRWSDGLSQRREPDVGSGVLEGRERAAMVMRALGALAPEQRAILLLRDAYGLEYGAIAESLEIAVGTVKSRLFRARAALRFACEADGVVGLDESEANDSGRNDG